MSIQLDHSVGSAIQPAARPLERGVDWRTQPLELLVDHIVSRHHAFTRKELAQAHRLAEKVRNVHGAGHPELAEVVDLVVELADEMIPHLQKEERVLFPSILALTNVPSAPSALPFGSVSMPIARMMADHKVADEILAELRAVTLRYRLPEGACGSYRALYTSLADLDRDLQEHMRLEGDILFPRAEALAERC